MLKSKIDTKLGGGVIFYEWRLKTSVEIIISDLLVQLYPFTEDPTQTDNTSNFDLNSFINLSRSALYESKGVLT